MRTSTPMTPFLSLNLRRRPAPALPNLGAADSDKTGVPVRARAIASLRNGIVVRAAAQ